MSLFAVSKYFDQIKVKAEREFEMYTKPPVEKYHYFDTEQEAKTFIADRAFALVTAAERALTKAEQRYKKCLKKFGTRS